MGIAERRQREKEAVRAQILAAATELFANEGFEAVSMRKIADKIEYAPSTIYLYFKDKEELSGTIVTEVFDELTGVLEKIQNEQHEPLEAFRRGILAYIRFGLEHPHHYAVTFGNSPIPEVPGELTAADRAALKCFDQLRQCLQRCMDAGAIRPADIGVLSETIWTFIHGTTDILICQDKVVNFPWAPKEQVIETAVDLIVRSIKIENNP